MKMGKKGEAKYRVIVKEKRDRRDGKAVEILGWYQKTAKGSTKDIDMERVKYWVSQGAKLSSTVEKIIA